MRLIVSLAAVAALAACGTATNTNTTSNTNATANANVVASNEANHNAAQTASTTAPANTTSSGAQTPGEAARINVNELRERLDKGTPSRLTCAAQVSTAPDISKAALDSVRCNRGARLGVAARQDDRHLLLLTGREFKRPCGARHQRKGNHERGCPPRRLRSLGSAGLPTEKPKNN